MPVKFLYFLLCKKAKTNQTSISNKSSNKRRSPSVTIKKEITSGRKKTYSKRRSPRVKVKKEIAGFHEPPPSTSTRSRRSKQRPSYLNDYEG